MEELYLLGEWSAKEGREEEFVAAWHELARWMESNVDGASWAKLLRDREDPRRFMSVGSPWRDDDAVAAWRERPEFRSRFATIQEVVSSFVPHTMHVAAEVGAATPDP